MVSLAGRNTITFDDRVIFPLSVNGKESVIASLKNNRSAECVA